MPFNKMVGLYNIKLKPPCIKFGRPINDAKYQVVGDFKHI